jgi:hypothetical protein
MRTPYFIFLLVLCGGCILPGRSYQVVKYEPFSSYMVHDLTIKRTTYLFKERFMPASMFDVTSPLFDDKRYIQEQMREGKVLAILPPGTVVHLVGVRRWWDGESGVQHFEARGEVTLPQTEEKVTFIFGWEGLPSDSIQRAPWDDDSVPQKRYVGEDGKSFKP